VECGVDGSELSADLIGRGGREFFFLLMNEISTFSGFMDGIQKGMGRGGWGYGAGDISLLHVELELVEMLVM
jgi:hypothetical protein